jgi:ferrous iron transport protein B
MPATIAPESDLAVTDDRTLADLRPGQGGRVAGLRGPIAVRRRLAEMGLVPGVDLAVARVAPLGDPIEITLRGYRLSLRADQARCVALGAPAVPPAAADPVRTGDPVDLNQEPVIAVAGNPNAGKTTLFNAITGLRQHVANYPGVTVERKEGRAPLPGGRRARFIDLPGIYSLVPSSPDERVAVEVLAGLRADTPRPDAVLAVVDATNLARNLLLVTQILDTGLPVVVALTMVDEARRLGMGVDAPALEQALGVAVVPVVAATGEGLLALAKALTTPRCAIWHPWAGPALAEHDRLTDAVLAQAQAQGRSLSRPQAHAVAWGLLGDGDFTGVLGLGAVEPLIVAVARARDGWQGDPVTADIARRYAWIDAIAVRRERSTARTLRERVDAVLLHRIAGPAAFALVMWGLFVAIFTLAAPLMDASEGIVLAAGGWVAGLMTPGLARDLWSDGIVKGVGGVVIFAPQIAFMFILLAVLDASGYLARGAFILDRLLRGVGLHGRSFVPLLSSHACAIPGVMAARTIPDARERLTTMLVAPFMACSARLPVYALLIGMFFGHLAGWQQGSILAGLFLGGIVAAAGVAFLLRRTVLAGAGTSFLIELPPYRWPALGEVARVTGRAVKAFLVRAGTLILALSILLWAAMTFPRLPEARQMEIAAAHGTTLDGMASAPEADATAAAQAAIQQAALRHSLAGRLGGAIEPVIAPAGMDWQIGVGLVGAFAAREVFVSTMGIVHGVGAVEDETAPLEEQMRAATRPDGTPLWSPLLAVAVMAWFVLAMQCLSTVGVMVRETGGWRWPLIQLVGMNALAWAVAVAIWQIGSRL